MSERTFDRYDGPDRIKSKASSTLQRQEGNAASSTRSEPSTLDHLTHAVSETSRPLDTGLRTSLSQQLGHDFSKVRIHSGPASARAAEAIGARAYTLGNRIHLGKEARGLSSNEQSRLLAHEAVHTVQQGGRDVTPSADLEVSSPNDAAEREAHRIAESFNAQPHSPSIGLRDRLRSSMPHQRISRSVDPRIQRDLTGKHKVAGGEFKMNLKTESHPAPAKSGMKGTIKFKANEKAPDSTSIRLLQVVRFEDLSTGADYVWKGAHANRSNVMTTGGYGVDFDPTSASATPRTSKADPTVSPYYRDYWPNVTHSQDGSKRGKTIREASLWDYPGANLNIRFSFETIAKAADTGHVYGTVMWGFTISDAAKGKVEKERAVGRNVTLATTDKAIEKFNEFFKNPGASTAP